MLNTTANLAVDIFGAEMVVDVLLVLAVTSAAGCS